MRLELFTSYIDKVDPAFVFFKALLKARPGDGSVPRVYKATVHVSLRLGWVGRALFMVSHCCSGSGAIKSKPCSPLFSPQIYGAIAGFTYFAVGCLGQPGPGLKCLGCPCWAVVVKPGVPELLLFCSYLQQRSRGLRGRIALSLAHKLPLDPWMKFPGLYMPVGTAKQRCRSRSSCRCSTNTDQNCYCKAMWASRSWLCM